MPVVNNQRVEECKTEAMQIFNQLLSRGIKMVGCGYRWTEDKSDLVIQILIHASESDQKHDLPINHKGFQVEYEYIEYDKFVSLVYKDFKD